MYFGRIIFHTEDMDKSYSYLRNNKTISNLISFESEPTNATWMKGSRILREPGEYQLSFAESIAKKRFINLDTHENGQII